MSGTITHDVTTLGTARTNAPGVPSVASVPGVPGVPGQRVAAPARRAPAADAAWRLNVLGPVELCHDGQSVQVGGATRTLLVLLARAAGAEVGTASIVAGIWGSEPPADAENAVATSVSRLRKALTAVAPDVDPTSVVVTMPTGYILDIRAPNIDVATFERFVADAQNALAVGQPALASARVGAALRLWRGEAYSDVREQSFARAEAARLSELRLAAIELRVEAALAIAAPGVPETLVAELDALLAEHWHRERLWAALMTALFRLGRRSEALAAHRQAQISLAEGLGAHPGPELRAVERRVLDRDPALFGRAFAATDLPAPIAATMPACHGRHEEADWLEAALDLAAARRAQARLVVGSPGVGKTRLVAEVAQRAAERAVVVRYGRGDLGGDLNCAEVLGTEPDRLSLVVIDDVDLCTPEDVAAVTAFVRDTVNSTVHTAVLTLLTCRDTIRVGDLAGLPKLVLTALDDEAVAGIVRVYAPSTTDATAVAAMVNTGGVPARVHRAASEWAFARAGRRIDRAVDVAGEPTRRLAALRAEVRAGVLDLGHVRAQARLLRPTPRHVVAPYKGLDRYDPADSELLHGREDVVAELVARLVEAPLLVVVGAAGTGKSSAVRAGLLPALAAGALPDSATWRQVVLTPASVGSLADSLRAGAPATAPDPEEGDPGSADPGSVHDEVIAPHGTGPDGCADDGGLAGGGFSSDCSSGDGSWSDGSSGDGSSSDGSGDGFSSDGGTPAGEAPDGATVASGAGTLVVVDQFEQVFTVLDAERRSEFLTTLVAALTRASSPSPGALSPGALSSGAPSSGAPTNRVVLTVRSDFYPRCAEHPELGPLVAANTFALAPMSTEQLWRAVERPAAMADASFADGVVATIVSDAAARPGDLAGLSTALLAMWRSGPLTLAGYHSSGGVAGAVDVFADQAYAALTSDGERAATQAMTLALVQTPDGADGADGAVVRRRVGVADLLEIAGTRGPAALAVLANHGLVTIDGDEVELVHDAVLTGWHRLRGWIDDAAAMAQLRRHLAHAAAAWAAAETDRSLLYGGVRLAAALDWAAAHPADVGGTEQAFLMASRQVLLAAEMRRRRRVTRLWKWLAAMTLALAVAVAVSTVAVLELAKADQAGQRADAARLAAQARVEPDLRVALLLAVAAGTLDPAAADSVRDVLLRSPDLAAAAGTGVSAVALAPDGATVAVGSWDGSITVFSTTGVDGGGVDGGGVDGGGAGSHGGVRFERSDQARVSGLAFSPDGRRLVSWGASGSEQATGTIVVWDVAAGAPVGPAFGQVAAAAAGGLLADGVTLLLSQRGPAGASTTTVAWNIEARTPSTAYVLPETAAEGLALSPDGRRVAWGTADATIIIDPVTGDRRTIAGATRPSALSQDGSTLVTIEANALVTWDVGSGERVGEARRHGADVLDAVWSAGGRTFASVDAAGLIVVWDARALQPTHVLTGSLTPVRVVRFAPDGLTLYTVGDDGALLAWDLTGTKGIGSALADPALPTDPAGIACALAGRDMTRDEWAAHVGDRPYQHVCPH